MQPRLDNGTFKYTDPRHCTVHDPLHATCYMDGSNMDGFYEGGPIVVRTNNSGVNAISSCCLIQYSQYVPHDTARLIELQGGKDAFIKRLDYIFDNVSAFHTQFWIDTQLTWTIRGTLTRPTNLRSRSHSCTTMLIDQGRAPSAHGRRSHETTTRPSMDCREMMVRLQVLP